MAETQWYFARDGQQLGPVPESELRRLAAGGALAPTDLVWQPGMAQWQPAREATGFYPAAVPPPLPPHAAFPPPQSGASGVVGYATPYPAYGGPARQIGDDPAMRLLLPVGRSVWAIVAGYLGLFSVLLLPAPIALIVSLIAISHLRRDPSKHGIGRAVFGLVMGALGTIGLLFAVVRAAGV